MTTGTKIKRSLVKSYLDTMPTGTPSYQLMGDGHKTGLIQYNPKSTEEQYINQDTASNSLDAYAPSLGMEMTALNGEPVFEFLDALRKARAISADAETTLVNVDAYETAISGSYYPAEKQPVVLMVDAFGGDAGTNVVLNYTLKYNGDATRGHFYVSGTTGNFVSW